MLRVTDRYVLKIVSFVHSWLMFLAIMNKTEINIAKVIQTAWYINSCSVHFIHGIFTSFI